MPSASDLTFVWNWFEERGMENIGAAVIIILLGATLTTGVFINRKLVNGLLSGFFESSPSYVLLLLSFWMACFGLMIGTQINPSDLTIDEAGNETNGETEDDSQPRVQNAVTSEDNGEEHGIPGKAGQAWDEIDELSLGKTLFKYNIRKCRDNEFDIRPDVLMEHKANEVRDLEERQTELLQELEKKE